MRDKWNAKKKGYLKIHVAIDIKKSKKVLSSKVTDEHIHDNKVLLDMVNSITKKSMIVGKILADGSYDSNDICRCLVVDSGIYHCICVRKNARETVNQPHSPKSIGYGPEE